MDCDAQKAESQELQLLASYVTQGRGRSALWREVGRRSSFLRRSQGHGRRSTNAHLCALLPPVLGLSQPLPRTRLLRRRLQTEGSHTVTSASSSDVSKLTGGARRSTRANEVLSKGSPKARYRSAFREVGRFCKRHRARACARLRGEVRRHVGTLNR